LKPKGYATAIVGKWHLGHLPPFQPMRQGFDVWFGLPFSHDMKMTVARDNDYATAAYYDPKPEYWNVPLVRNGEVIEQPADHRTLTRRYTDEAVRFIDANKARPFFLYFAHNMPHIPLARSADYVGRSAAGIYGDVVEEIDGAWDESSMRCGPPASTDGRWSCSRATTVRGCRSRRTADRPVRSVTAKARRGKAASARRRFSGGRARSGRRRSRTSDQRWTCSPPPRSSRAPRSRPIVSSTASICVRAHRIRAESARAAVLLLRQRASCRAKGRIQGALHHQRLVQRRREARRAQSAASLQPRRRSRRALRRRREAPGHRGRLVKEVEAHRKTIKPTKPLFDELLK
jgi:hypothetical protein